MYHAEILLPSVLLIVVLYSSTNSGGEDCSISTSSLNYKNEPVLLRDSFIVLPVDGEQIFIPSGESLQVACPGNGNAVMINDAVQESSLMTAVCQGNGQFKIAQHDAFFGKISCKNTVEASIKTLETECGENSKKFIIGFEVNGDFITNIMSGCYSDVLQKPLYVQHKISRALAYSAGNVPRPRWNDENKDIDSLYAKQRKIINGQLGLPETDDKYIKNGNSKYRLSRGHLAAKADFFYGSQQRATFFISNSAPQWLTNNDVHWRYLEECIRDFAINTYKDYEVYTGTYGVTELPENNSNHFAELFLKPNYGKVPVPNFFWKVIRDPATSKGAAFIVYNNPYISTVKNTVCPGKDVCDRITYLDKRIRADDYVSGFFVCCKVEDLRNMNTHLPEFPTSGLLT